MPGDPSHGAGGDGRDARHALSEFFTVTGRRTARRHYGRFVGITKLLLFSLAACLIVALALWPRFSGRDDTFEIGVSNKVQPEDVESLRVTNARLTGVNQDGRPYTVTFGDARQTNQDSDLVHLTAPQADVELPDGAWVALSSPRGRYHRANRILELDGEVNLYHDGGMELRTGNITFNLATGTGAGHDPVHAQAPFGWLDAQGFRIRENTAVFLFTGPVRAVLVGPPEVGR